MADLTFYTLSDPETLASALEGVAMVFDPSNSTTWVSGGSFGLGAVAGIGLLCTLLFILGRAVLTQRLELQTVLIIAVAYSIAFAQKTTVQVENVSSADVAVVDNVPYAVALPGALITGITKSISDDMELAFSDPDFGPVSQSGFMDPLRVLLALRESNLGKSASATTANIRSYLQYCMEDGNSGVRTDVDRFLSKATSASGGMALFTSASAQNGVAVWQERNPNTKQVVTSYRNCKRGSDSVAEKLNADISAMASGADAGLCEKGFGSFGAAGACLSDIYHWGVSNQETTGGAANQPAVQKIDRSLQAILGSSMVQRDQVIKDLVLGNLMKSRDAMDITDPNFVNATTMQTEAMEKMRVEAASQGSGFLTMAEDGMNIMLFIWIGMAPLVALIVVMMGLQGLKNLGQYMLFGAWTQSWMICAIVVNYYMQLSLRNELKAKAVALYNTSSADALAGLFAVNNQPELYQAISNKMAMASKMLAFSPMLTGAVIFGAYTQLSSLFNAGGVKPDTDKMVGDTDRATGAEAAVKSYRDLGYDSTGIQSSAGNVGFSAATKHKGDRLGSVELGAQLSQLQGDEETFSQRSSEASNMAYESMFSNKSAVMKRWTDAVKNEYTKGGQFKKDDLVRDLNSWGVDTSEAKTESQLVELAAMVGAAGEVNARVGKADTRFNAAQAKQKEAERNLKAATPGTVQHTNLSNDLKAANQELEAAGNEKKAAVNAALALKAGVTDTAKTGDAYEQKRAAAIRQTIESGTQRGFSESQTAQRAQTHSSEDAAATEQAHQETEKYGRQYQQSSEQARQVRTGIQAARNASSTQSYRNADMVMGIGTTTTPGVLETDAMNAAGFDGYGNQRGDELKDRFSNLYDSMVGTHGKTGALVYAASTMMASGNYDERAVGARMYASMLSHWNGAGTGDVQAFQQLASTYDGFVKNQDGRESTGAFTERVKGQTDGVPQQIGEGAASIGNKAGNVNNQVTDQQKHSEQRTSEGHLAEQIAGLQGAYTPYKSQYESAGKSRVLGRAGEMRLQAADDLTNSPAAKELQMAQFVGAGADLADDYTLLKQHEGATFGGVGYGLAQEQYKLGQRQELQALTGTMRGNAAEMKQAGGWMGLSPDRQQAIRRDMDRYQELAHDAGLDTSAISEGRHARAYSTRGRTHGGSGSGARLQAMAGHASQYAGNIQQAVVTQQATVDEQSEIVEQLRQRTANNSQRVENLSGSAFENQRNQFNGELFGGNERSPRGFAPVEKK